MQDCSVAECAYFAGIIDGEGSVQARYRTGRKGGFDYLISLANTDHRMVQWVADRWRGAVFHLLPRNDRSSEQWLWRAHGSHAVIALEAALPYLIVKREQADLVLRLARSGRITGRAGYSVEEKEARIAIVQALSVLNRRGPTLPKAS